MPPSDDEPQYLDEHHQRMVEFANDYIDEADREAFVDGLLEKHGYTRHSVWAPPERDPKKPPTNKRPGFYGPKR